MPSRSNLARIHILKKEAHLTEDQYRLLLAGRGVESSKEFTDKQAYNFCQFLEDYIGRNSGKGKDVPGWGKNKYEYLRGRTGDFAEPQQLRKIEAIWRDVARNKSDAALLKFIENKTGMQNIEWLKKNHVEPLLLALQDMKAKMIQKRQPKKNQKRHA